jgi:hypothetical protein
MKKMFRLKWWAPLLAFSVWVLAACGESVPELAQAADVIHYMMKLQHLSLIR